MAQTAGVEVINAPREETQRFLGYAMEKLTKGLRDREGGRGS